MTTDRNISSAMRVLAGMPDHPATDRVIKAAKPEVLIEALLPALSSARAISFRYGDPRPIYDENGEAVYSEEGELIVKFHKDTTDRNAYISRLDINGDQMLRLDGTWGWATSPPLMSLKDALCYCFEYIKKIDREILSFDIRHTFYN